MFGLVLRRLAALVPLCLAISFLAFCLTSLSPSDPAEVALRVNDITPTPEVIEATRHELGLDKPFFERYLVWLKGALQGDLGKSYVTHLPVAEEMAKALLPSLALAFSAVLVVLCVGIPCAILCFVAEGRLPDAVARALVFLASATPTFWTGLLFIWLFSVHLNLLPTGGLEGPTSFILPALTLALPSLATYTRLLRASMLATGQQDFVLYLKAQGRHPLAIAKASRGHLCGRVRLCLAWSWKTVRHSHLQPRLSSHPGLRRLHGPLLCALQSCDGHCGNIC